MILGRPGPGVQNSYKHLLIYIFLIVARPTDQEEKEQCSEGRRKWTDCPPDTLLNALAKAQLTNSTLGNMAKYTVEADECKSLSVTLL